MRVSLMFCTQHYVCFIRIIIFCLFILVLSFILEVFSTEFLLRAHLLGPFGVFRRGFLFWLLLLLFLGQKLWVQSDNILIYLSTYMLGSVLDNSYLKPIRQVLLLLALPTWGNWSTERPCNLAKVTQPVDGRAGVLGSRTCPLITSNQSPYLEPWGTIAFICV